MITLKQQFCTILKDKFAGRNLPDTEIMQNSWSPEVKAALRDAMNESPGLFNTGFVSRILGVSDQKVRRARMYRKPNKVV